MRKLRALWVRLTRVRGDEQEFEAELESHVAMDTDAGVRTGLSCRGSAPSGAYPAGRR